jgi:hypothetical protein
MFRLFWYGTCLTKHTIWQIDEHACASFTKCGHGYNMSSVECFVWCITLNMAWVLKCHMTCYGQMLWYFLKEHYRATHCGGFEFTQPSTLKEKNEYILFIPLTHFIGCPKNTFPIILNIPFGLD